jgi:hypothetical protein
MQELGSLMLKAGKAGDASKYLQQALEMTVGTVVCVMYWHASWLKSAHNAMFSFHSYSLSGWR